MGTGTERRVVVNDSLAGEALVTPARLAGPGIQAPRVPAIPQETMTQRITNSIGKWATDQLVEEAKKEHERSLMDGAIQAVQGKTFDQLQMDGADKWSMQGHRLITAQTMAASITSAQSALITNSAYALSPDEYREQLGGQLQMLVDGQDPRTARMIRERMTDALPELIAKHTVAYANHNEQLAYQGLIDGISAQSTDPMSVDAMLSFVAGGEGSASGALSDARRVQATTEGIVLGFVEGNPLPFALIKEAGLLEGMSSDQLNRINDAETQYTNKLMNAYNEERQDRHIANELERDNGNITEQAFRDTYINITEDYGGKVFDVDTHAAYRSATEPYQTGQQTRWLTAEAARARGDTKAFAAATVGIVIKHESDGDPDVVSKKGAEGLLQVMPPTQRDPGFGLRPSDGSAEDTVRLGKEYWALMIEGRGNKFGLFDWDPMDVEAAAIAYNAGSENANLWFNANKDYSVLPVQSETEPFAKKILKDYNDREAPNRASKYNRAKNLKASADKVASAEKWSLASRLMADEDEKRVSGRITEEEWLNNRSAILKEYKIDLNKGIVTSELALTKSMRAVAAKALAKLNDDTAMAQIDQMLQVAELEYKLTLADESIDFKGMLAANTKYVEQSDAAFAKFGISIVDKRNQSAIRSAWKSMITAIKPHQEHAMIRTKIAAAVAEGSVAGLSPKLQEIERDERLAAGAKDIQEAFLLSDQGPEAEQAMADQMNNLEWAGIKNNGFVPDSFSLAEGKFIRPDVIFNDDDEVNELSVASISRFIEFSKQAPFLSRDFYPENRKAFANAVVDVAGIDGNIAEALKRVHKERLVNALQSESLNTFKNAEKTQEQVNDTMKRFIEREDTSFAQALFSGDVDLIDPTRVLVSEQDGRKLAEPAIMAALTHELGIQKVLDKNMDTDRLLITAQQRLEERSDFIGGSWVYTDFNIKKAMFGDKASNFDKVGIVNEAIILYYADLNKAVGQEGIGDVGIFEFLPRGLQIRTILGFGLDLDAGMSFLDAPEAILRGMRPFTSGVDADGKLTIRVFNDRGGQGVPITLPMEKIGDYFMHRNPNFRSDIRGDPVRNPKRGTAEGTIFGDTLFGRDASELN